MAERHVLIRAYGLRFPFNAVVPQSALKMGDEALDEFIAAGYAIEFEPAPPRDEAFMASLVEAMTAPLTEPSVATQPPVAVDGEPAVEGQARLPVEGSGERKAKRRQRE